MPVSPAPARIAGKPFTSSKAKRRKVSRRSSRASAPVVPVKEPEVNDALIAYRDLLLAGIDAIEQAWRSSHYVDREFSKFAMSAYEGTHMIGFRLRNDIAFKDEKEVEPVGLDPRPVEQVWKHRGEDAIALLRVNPELAHAYDLTDRWMDRVIGKDQDRDGNAAAETVASARAYLSHAIGLLDAKQTNRDSVIYGNPFSDLVHLGFNIIESDIQDAIGANCPEHALYVEMLSLLKQARAIKDKIYDKTKHRPSPDTSLLIKRASAKVRAFVNARKGA